MNGIVLAILVVAGVGLLIGLILAVASVIMAVPTDKKAEAISECLPGANCGACGYTGCDGYAKALSKGEAENGLCIPGGEGCVKAIADILGVAPVAQQKKNAVVHCLGSCDNTQKNASYQGVQSCLSMSKLHGINACSFGCLGCGDCTNACKFDAIKVCNGVAVVDNNKCTGCGACAVACPKKLISIVNAENNAVVRCSNHDKGAITRKACSVGCIGCMKCVKVCEVNAVSVKNFCASVDFSKCIGCMKCIEECPQGCITQAF